MQHDDLAPDDLAPDIRRFQQALAAAYAAHPPLDSVDLHAARRIAEQVRAPLAQGGPAMVQREDHWIEGGTLRLRVLRPHAARPLPALVYLHGGGWVFFSLDTHDRLMRELAARSGRVVIGVDYARAPEARFPVALEQTLAAFRWARDGAAGLGLDASRIALGGDSAGANLALAAALDLRADAAGPDALLLLYGVYTDDEGGGAARGGGARDAASFDRFDGPAYTLGRDEMRGFWRQYLRSDADRDDPRAMPLKAALHGLPRCALVVAECDVLRDGNLALAARLRAAGVSTSLQRHAGATHSFLEAVSFSPLADRALAQCTGWLRGGRPA